MPPTRRLFRGCTPTPAFGGCVPTRGPRSDELARLGSLGRRERDRRVAALTGNPPPLPNFSHFADRFRHDLGSPVILPYVAAFNLPAAPSARVALCRALRTDDPAGVLTDLAAAVGAPALTRRARGGAGPRPSASGPSRGRRTAPTRRCRTAPPVRRPWNPHHLVISSASRHGRGTCSATFADRQMSTLRSANGKSIPESGTNKVGSPRRAGVACISAGSGSTPCDSVLLRIWGLAAAERVFWRSGSSCVRVNYANRVPSLTLAARELCLTIPSECNAAMSSHPCRRSDRVRQVDEGVAMAPPRRVPREFS